MPHWLSVLWAGMWGNMFAPSVWTLIGIAASHWHQVRLHKKTQDITQATREGGDGGR